METHQRKLMGVGDIPAFVDEVIKAGCDICAIRARLLRHSRLPAAPTRLQIAALVKTLANDANLICQLADGFARLHALEKLQFLVLINNSLPSGQAPVSSAGTNNNPRVCSLAGGCNVQPETIYVGG